MKLLSVSIVAAGMLASSAQAAEWRLMWAKDDAYAWVEESTIRGSRAKIAWTAIVYLERSPSTGDVDILMAREEYNCELRRRQILNLNGFSIDGNNLLQSTPSTNWIDIIPETGLDLSYKAICLNEYIFDTPVRSGSIYEAAKRLRSIIQR